MISASHWGLFPSPRPVFVIPKLSEEDERRMRDALRQPGHIVWLEKDSTVEFLPGRDDFA